MGSLSCLGPAGLAGPRVSLVWSHGALLPPCGLAWASFVVCSGGSWQHERSGFTLYISGLGVLVPTNQSRNHKALSRAKEWGHRIRTVWEGLPRTGAILFSVTYNLSSILLVALYSSNGKCCHSVAGI